VGKLARHPECITNEEVNTIGKLSKSLIKSAKYEGEQCARKEQGNQKKQFGGFKEFKGTIRSWEKIILVTRNSSLQRDYKSSRKGLKN